MPQYMLLLGGNDRAVSEKNSDVTMQKYSEWTQSLVTRNLLREAHKLKDGEGRRIEVRGGKTTDIVDGPYVETKETIGGYYLIEVDDYAAAVAIARECPVLRYQHGFVEVRLIEI